MRVSKTQILQRYEIFASYLFLTYLFLIISFGRPASILHFEIGGFPVFMTETVLFFCLPLAAEGLRQMISMPRRFFIFCLAAFALLGFTHLGKALLIDGNLMALRDIVFCVYILFLPITLRAFSKPERFHLFLVLLIAANVIALILGRLFMRPPEDYSGFFVQMRTFNFGLYFGLGTAFLTGLLVRAQGRAVRIFLFLLMGMNIYMIFLVGSRASWMAFLAQAVVLAFLFGKRIIPLLPGLFISFFVIAGSLGVFDFYLAPSRHSQVVASKFQTVTGILKWFGSGTAGKERARAVQIAAGSAPRIDGVVLEPAVLKDFVDLKNVINVQDQDITVLKDSVNLKNVISVQDIADSKHVAAAGIVVMEEVSAPEQATPGRSESFIEQVDALRSQTKDVDVDYHVVMSSFYWRLRILEQSFQFGLEKPVWGQGYGMYPAYRVYNDDSLERRPVTFAVNSKVIPAHNHLATVFYKMGFTGLGLFLLINGYVFGLGFLKIKGIRQAFFRDFLAGGLAAFAFWHVLALSFDVIDSPPTTVFLWILMGVIFSVIDLNERVEYEKT